MKGDELDPKGLIADAYAIEGIGPGECRSIFLDWALSLPDGVDARTVIPQLLARHAQDGHPMTEVLRDGMSRISVPRRRGGRRARSERDD